MEVHQMLRTFTRNDQLQEQYRLQEEWLRVQRTEEYARQKLQQDYAHILKMKEQAEKERSQAFFILQKKDQEIIRLKQMLESKLDGTTS
jgi:type II secretory pathway component PulF